MTYEVAGTQYVLICAGGTRQAPGYPGDYVVAISLVPGREVIPTVDSAICHDAVAWSGHRFIVNRFSNQTATLVLTSAFQGVPPPAGERFGGWSWRTNCSSGAYRSPRQKTACASYSQERERLNRLRW